MRHCTLLLFTLFTIATAEAADQQSARIRFLPHPAFDVGGLPATARQRLEAVKVGITRKQLSVHFVADGGLIFPFAERYYLRDTTVPGQLGKVVMLDLAFKPAAMDEETFSNPIRRVEWMRKHDWSAKATDTVQAFSKPYVSGIAID
jgi:hypothetical protein